MDESRPRHQHLLSIALCIAAFSACQSGATQPALQTPPSEASTQAPDNAQAETKTESKLPPLPPTVDPPSGPVLQEQSFLSTDARTAAGPWPPLAPPSDAPEPSAPKVEKLRAWLLANWETLRTWPPQFGRDETARQQAERAIVSWRKLLTAARDLETDAYTSPDTTHLLATYYYFGHNLDEEGAGPRASALIERAIFAHPKSALAWALRGFLDLHASPGKSSEASFLAALQLDPSPELEANILMGLGAACGLSWKPHRSLMYFDEALRAAPPLRREYKELTDVARGRFEPSMDVEWDAQQIFTFEKQRLSSSFFGFAMTLPPGWQVDKASPYEPHRPAVIYLDAPRLPGSGVIHGLVIIPQILDTSAGESTFLKQLVAAGGTSKPLTPLIESPHLRQWHIIDSHREIGAAGDIIQTFYVEATTLQSPWTREQHQEAADKEGNCSPPQDLTKPPSEEVHILRHAPLRVNAPVRIALTYNASTRTMQRARERFRRILMTLDLEERAGTSVSW